jgi:hypothetical protein
LEDSVKKILFSLLFLGVCGIVHAGQNVAILPSQTITYNYAVTCSSLTATALVPATVYRKGVRFKNIASYTVRIATFATTNNAVGYPIAANGEFIDEQEAYSGAWYGISIGPTSNVVDVLEKIGVIYQ